MSNVAVHSTRSETAYSGGTSCEESGRSEVELQSRTTGGLLRLRRNRVPGRVRGGGRTPNRQRGSCLPQTHLIRRRSTVLQSVRRHLVRRGGSQRLGRHGRGQVQALGRRHAKKPGGGVPARGPSDQGRKRGAQHGPSSSRAAHGRPSAYAPRMRQQKRGGQPAATWLREPAPLAG